MLINVSLYMKRNKQRRLAIREKRRRSAEKLSINTLIKPITIPNNAVMADWEELKHNNTYGPLPKFYIDRSFTCQDCGSKELWTAKQQKWWYEIVKGDINSTAIRCLRCRHRIQAKKEQQKRHMERREEIESHPNEKFFRNT